MKPKYDMPMPKEDNNALQYFGLYKDERYILDEQDTAKDYRDFVNKNSLFKSHRKDSMLGRSPENWLFASVLSLFLKEVRFSEQIFLADKPVSNIKYHYLNFQNINLFYPFNNQLDYALANYFTEFQTTKGNINRFLSNQLMSPLIEKLSYENVDK